MIVVDAGSSLPLRAQGADVGLRLESADANAARNAGIAAARGELIVLIDDDVAVPPGWLAALVAGAARWPQADCFGGPVKPVLSGPLPRLCGEHGLAGTAFGDGDVERSVLEVWGGNMAIRRSALARVGDFREGLAFHQEWEWEQRLLATGGRIVYLPDAWLWHHIAPGKLRPATLVHEYLRRGYVRGSLDPSVSGSGSLRRGRYWLAHALRTGCTRGWTEAARSLGLWCGTIAASRSASAPALSPACGSSTTSAQLM